LVFDSGLSQQDSSSTINPLLAIFNPLGINNRIQPKKEQPFLNLWIWRLHQIRGIHKFKNAASPPKWAR